MSYHFRIIKNIDITYKELMPYLPKGSVYNTLNKNILDNSSLDKSTMFFILKKSTRGILVRTDGSEYWISLYICSSLDDYRLLFQLVKAIAKLTNSNILPEGFLEELPIPEFEENFDEQWFKDIMMSGFSFFKVMTLNAKNPSEMTGCVRRYYIGTDMMKKFLKDNPTDEQLYNKIISNFKSTQFIDREKIHIPNRIEGSENGNERRSYIVIFADAPHLITKVDFIVFSVPDGEFYKVKFEDFKKFGITKFKRLDEEQFIFPSHTIEEMIEILKHIESTKVEKK